MYDEVRSTTQHPVNGHLLMAVLSTPSSLGPSPPEEPGERFLLTPPSALWTGEVPSLRGGGGQTSPDQSSVVGKRETTASYPLILFARMMYRDSESGRRHRVSRLVIDASSYSPQPPTTRVVLRPTYFVIRSAAIPHSNSKSRFGATRPLLSVRR